jgi:hypothetical protein
LGQGRVLNRQLALSRGRLGLRVLAVLHFLDQPA